MAVLSACGARTALVIGGRAASVDSGTPAVDGGKMDVPDAGDVGTDTSFDAPADSPAPGSMDVTEAGTPVCLPGDPPAVLSAVPPEAGAHGIALDDERVYWSINDSVLSVDKRGGTVSTLVSKVSQPFGVAVDGQYVYYTANDGVWTVSKSGGTPTLLAPPVGNPWFIALDDTTVYWGTQSGMSVMAAPKGGGPSRTVATGTDLVLGVALDATQLYFVSGTSILSVSKAGGTVAPLADGGAAGWGIAVDSSAVYWTVPSFACAYPPCGRVNRVTLAEDPLISTLASALDPMGIAVDGSNVYIGDWEHDAGVVAVPRAGGAARTIEGDAFVTVLAVDASCVYSLAEDGLHRAPK